MVVKERDTVQEQNPQGAGVPVRKSKSRGKKKKEGNMILVLENGNQGYKIV